MSQEGQCSNQACMLGVHALVLVIFSLLVSNAVALCSSLEQMLPPNTGGHGPQVKAAPTVLKAGS